NGISVFLDVVYNHIGPEGNYLPKFGPYFQSKYKTPWGDALNFDGDWSDEVRHYFLQNARQWLEEFHFDGLRLDAVHAIFDTSARPFLEDLTRLKKEIEAQRKIPLHLIAESEANDSRILMPYEEGGLALDGQWADDLHHVVHTLTTGEHDGYYSDYGKLEQLATAYQDGVVFHGEFSEARHRSHGRRYDKIERTRLVVCSQNHDQIGNRMKGERLLTLTNFEKQKLAAACVLLSPGLPLLFMGEEFAETAPFLYFIDHTDKDLLEAVRKGRKEEFKGFGWKEEPPDPGAVETFEACKLNWKSAATDPLAQEAKTFYKKLIEASKWIRTSGVLEDGRVKAKADNDRKVVEVCGENSQDFLQLFISFSDQEQKVSVPKRAGGLEILINTSDTKGSLEQVTSSPAQGELTLKPYSVIALRSRRVME
ncbi:MAG: malto-oligosyltrehalose trehalohydrolase, partial [Proteobacteria bacterium]